MSTTMPSVHDSSSQILRNDAQEPEHVSVPFRRILPIFSCVALCLMVSTLDQIMVSIAIPTIQSDFNAGALSSWLPTAYFLASTSVQPLYGRFSDIFGRRAVLCFALTVLLIGDFGSGFANSIEQLVAFRAVAGLGGGGILTLAQTVMSDVVSLRERGKYQSIIGVVLLLGYGVGPPIAGVLVQHATWRWCFWLNLPIIVAAFVLTLMYAPAKRVSERLESQLRSIDYIGSVLSLLGSVALTLSLIWGGTTFSWTSPVVISLLPTGVVVLVLFFVWEWYGATNPIVPIRIFKSATLVGVCVVMFISGFVGQSSTYYLAQYLQIAVGFSPTRSSLFAVPSLLGDTLANIVAGFIVTRFGRYKALIYGAFIIWAIGEGVLTLVTASTPNVVSVLAVLVFVIGWGGGEMLQPTVIAAQASVGKDDMSVVTAMHNYASQLGGTIALAAGSSAMNNGLHTSLASLRLDAAAIASIMANPALLSPSSPTRSSFLEKLGISSSQADRTIAHGYARLFIINAACSAFAAVVSLLMIQDIDLGPRIGRQTATCEESAPAESTGKEEHGDERARDVPEKHHGGADAEAPIGSDAASEVVVERRRRSARDSVL